MECKQEKRQICLIPLVTFWRDAIPSHIAHRDLSVLLDRERQRYEVLTNPHIILTLEALHISIKPAHIYDCVCFAHTITPPFQRHNV